MVYRSFTLKTSALIIVALLLLTSCTTTTGYRNPITKFQDASSVVIASTRTYLTELNKTERDKYIQEQLSAQAQIQLNQIEAVQVFSRDGLKARLDALDQLAGYGVLLARLANSDAPESIRTQVQGLGDALKNLSDETARLPNNSDNQSFKQAVGPVATILGEVFDLIIQQRIQAALDRAIQVGDSPVNRLLNAIHSDIIIAYQRKRNSLSDMRVILVDEYNRELSKSPRDSEKLRLWAERISANEDRWESFGNANPGEALDAMASAHTALVNYAKSPKGPTDLASLVDAIETFAARAQRVGQAIQNLRGLPKGVE
jgi:hypothetical protein